MGHIGAGGVDAHFRNQPGGRNPMKQKRTSAQDPDMNVSPLLKRSDSFSSFTGKETGFSSSKANIAGRYSGDNSIVCKKEAFYVVEVTPTSMHDHIKPLYQQIFVVNALNTVGPLYSQAFSPHIILALQTCCHLLLATRQYIHDSVSSVLELFLEFAYC